MVQYFQHDLFRAIPQTFYFDKGLVVHKHFGRHSGVSMLLLTKDNLIRTFQFFFAPHDLYVEEEAQMHLKNIMNVFNMLYGTWNHVHTVNNFHGKRMISMIKTNFSVDLWRDQENE